MTARVGRQHLRGDYDANDGANNDWHVALKGTTRVEAALSLAVVVRQQQCQWQQPRQLNFDNDHAEKCRR